MKKIPVLMLLLLSVWVSAQHNSNQQNFKKSAPKRAISDQFNENDYYSNDGRAQTQKLSTTRTLLQPANSNEIILECSALMNIKAESYMAIFNLTQVGASAKEADELLNARISSFIKAAGTLGIQESDIHIDMIYLIPIFEYETEKRLFSKTYNEVPKGFEMQKNVHIRFKKSDLVDDLVTIAASNEIYDLVSVEYFVKDAKAIYDTLRTQAIDFIAKNAAKFKKLGLLLDGEFRVVAENSAVTYPEEQYSDYESFVSQSLDAAKNKAVTSMRKPKTVAYNKIAYADFDIVINPEFLEPVAQFTYKIQVKYTLHDAKAEIKNNYYIIDSAGNLKQIFPK